MDNDGDGGNETKRPLIPLEHKGMSPVTFPLQRAMASLEALKGLKEPGK